MKGRNMLMNFSTWLAVAVAIIVPVAVYMFSNRE